MKNSQKTSHSQRSPWLFIPSLYFQQGLPVILVQQFSVLMYKKLGVPNEEIGLYTSLLTWPWILKMLWSPLVDSRRTKLAWVRLTQALITVLIAVSAFALGHSSFLGITLAIFLVIAFLSATHDIALDGYYLLALKPHQQAFFVGIRSTFFRAAMIFCMGTLVLIAGHFESQGNSVAQSWQRAILVGAIVYAILFAYGLWAAPRAALDTETRSGPKKNAPFRESFRSFFSQPKVGTVLLFILFYRFGESMLSKLSGVFLLDSEAAGGLQLSTTDVGWIIGNLGVISLVVGGLLGGFTISRFGLRRCLWPMALSLYLPNLFYLWAAYAKPGIGAVSWIIAVDQFGYGFGLAAYMVYLMLVAQRSRFQTSHYAIATGIMALGAMAAGIASGYVQKALGYPGFFLVICLMGLPGLFLLRLIPLDSEINQKELKELIAGD